MKLLRVTIYLKCTRDDFLTREKDYKQTLYWYVDADLSVHDDTKIYTRSVFYLGKGIIFADYTKQKVDARISTN